MRVTDRDRQRVGGVLGLRIGFRQQHADHHSYLRLLAVAGADHGLLHLVGRIFGDRQSGARRHQHGDAARLAELQGRGGVAVDESVLDRRLLRRVFLDHRDQPVMDHDQALTQARPLAGFHRAAGDVDQPVAVGFDQAPAGTAEPRIDAENANRLPGHGPLIAPRLPSGQKTAKDARPARSPSAHDRIRRSSAFPMTRRRSAICPSPLGIAAVSGLVRGFSGFGSALIYMPLISAVYSPQIAAPTLLLIDTLCGLPFVVRRLPHVNRRRGGDPAHRPARCRCRSASLVLSVVDPLLSALVHAAAGAGRAGQRSISGWRYHGKPTLPLRSPSAPWPALAAAQRRSRAPPLLVFWLGGSNRAIDRARQHHGLFLDPRDAVDRRSSCSTACSTAQALIVAVLLGRAVRRRADRRRLLISTAPATNFSTAASLT